MSVDPYKHIAPTVPVPGLAKSNGTPAAPVAPSSSPPAAPHAAPNPFGASAQFGELDAADAQMALTEAFVRSSVQINKFGLREAVFLEAYLGAEGTQIVNRILQLKPHQNPGALRRFRDGLKAISLYEFMGKIQVSLGGK